MVWKRWISQAEPDWLYFILCAAWFAVAAIGLNAAIGNIATLPLVVMAVSGAAAIKWLMEQQNN